MVFVRTFCVADLFVGCYGLGKMTMFFFVEDLLVNFFLPECLLLTAVTAACMGQLFLNVERGLKVCVQCVHVCV
jgi:sugar phosphate permease